MKRNYVITLVVLGALGALAYTINRHQAPAEISPLSLNAEKVSRLDPALRSRPGSLPEMEASVLRLAAKLDESSERPEHDEAALLSLVQSLSPSSADALKAIALGEGRTHNERFLAVYLLSQRPEDFFEPLAEIAKADHAAFHHVAALDTMQEKQRIFEASLRVQALTALETVREEKKRLLDLFSWIEENHPNAQVQNFARVGRVGLVTKTPLIGAYIEAKSDNLTQALRN
jgi:hypothetical protein